MDVQVLAQALRRQCASNIVEGERKRGGHGLSARPSDRRQFQAYICGRGRMRERADGNAICAGLRHGAHILERDAAGHFHDGPPFDDGDGLPDHGWSHVIQQNDVGFSREGLANVRQRFHFDNQGHGTGCFSMGESAGRADGLPAFLEQGEMVIFNQNAIAE